MWCGNPESVIALGWLGRVEGTPLLSEARNKGITNKIMGVVGGRKGRKQESKKGKKEERRNNCPRKKKGPMKLHCKHKNLKVSVKLEPQKLHVQPEPEFGFSLWAWLLSATLKVAAQEPRSALMQELGKGKLC